MPLFNPSPVTITPSTSGTATPTSVAASTSSVALLAANSNRKGTTIWNNSTASLYKVLLLKATGGVMKLL